MSRILLPYYRQERPYGKRPKYTPDQLVQLKQFLRSIRPFTRKDGFRQITKHDILLYPALVDREGNQFTASLLASLAKETYGFYVSRLTVDRLLGGNLRRRKLAKFVKPKVVRDYGVRLENLEKLVIRLAAAQGVDTTR